MATVTIEQVRSTCPTSLSDTVIDGVICMVNNRVGECLDSSYSDCEAQNLQMYLACHIVYLMDNPQLLASFRTPNGTSESFQNYTNQTGLGSTSFGKLILTFDTQGCVLKTTSKTLFIGTSGRSDPPYGRRVRRI